MGLPTQITDITAGLNALAATPVAAEKGDAVFLKMEKSSGDWIYGSDAVEADPDSRWAINPATLATGFICWGDREVVDERMATGTQPRIIKDELPRYEGRKWDEQIRIELVCISGEDEGVKANYSASSLGGKKEFDRLVSAIRAKAATGTTKFVPIVELHSDSYRHKSYGKINTPVFKIVEWADITNGLDDSEPEEPETPEEPAAPTRRSRRRA